MRTYLGWALRLVVFAFQFAWALIVASLDVAWDVIAPSNRFSPGIVEFPLRCRTPVEITAMANCITLTPGTLTVAMRSSPPTLWVHAMYASDRDKALADLRTYEGQMLRAVRRDGRADEEPGGVPADTARSGGREGEPE